MNWIKKRCSPKGLASRPRCGGFLHCSDCIKTAIARLLEAYFEEKRIRFWGLGSTTLRNQDKQAGKEPDKCYCIDTDKDIPDLAIEVVYTSGGVDTLEIYRRLGVYHGYRFAYQGSMDLARSSV